MGLKVTQNFILALVFVVSTLALFWMIIWRGLGGDNALFAIIGHTAAWAEFVAIFYFRKKPPAGSS